MIGTSYVAEASKFAPDTLLELFELDLTQFNSTTMYFHAGTNNSYAAIQFNGQTYTPFPVQITGFEFTGKTLPRPKAAFSNIAGTFTALLRDYQDLVGARLTRRRVFAATLSDPTASQMVDIYYIGRKTKETRHVVEFELVSPLELENVMLPKRQVVAHTCMWDYRGEECGFTSDVVIGDLQNGMYAGRAIAIPEWSPSTVYPLTGMVHWKGHIYISEYPSNLAHEPTLWSLPLDFDSMSQGRWLDSVDYTVGQYVMHVTRTYRCIKNTAPGYRPEPGVGPMMTPKWTEYWENVEFWRVTGFYGLFVVGKSYLVGEFVQSPTDGKVYRLLFPIEGAEAGDDPATFLVGWGATPTLWNAGVTYVTGDVVYITGDPNEGEDKMYYLAIQGSLNQPPPNVAYWKLKRWEVSQTPRGLWAVGTTYYAGDVVYILDTFRPSIKRYFLAKDTSTGITPPNSTYWAPDLCNKTLMACKARFDSNNARNPLPFGAFPGTAVLSV